MRCPAKISRGVRLGVLFCKKYEFFCKNYKFLMVFKNYTILAVDICRWVFSKKKSQPRFEIAIHKVTRQGIEPWTPTLRVSCSTS